MTEPTTDPTPEATGALGRLYTVVDGKFPLFTAAPQAQHSLTEFFLANPDGVREWNKNGNTSLILEAEYGLALARLADKYEEMGGTVHRWYEPDWGVPTPAAVTFEPEEWAQPFFQNLKLATHRGWWGERKRVRHLFRAFALKKATEAMRYLDTTRPH